MPFLYKEAFITVRNWEKLSLKNIVLQ